MSHMMPEDLSFEETVGVFLSDDPELALVQADMAAYMDAHLCNCHALCECEEDDERF